MKSTTVALGFLSGLASAGSFNDHHARHFHAGHFYRRANTTDAAQAASQTTLTVQVTSVQTVISCAPTVTNCPARNNTAALSTLPASMLTTAVVTQVIDLTTTVCPVADATSILTSVVEAHNSGLLPGTTHPATSTGVLAQPTATNEAVTTSKITKDTTLTMTVGPESARSTITTIMRSTLTQLVTVTMTRPGSESTESASPVGSEGDANSGNSGSSLEEGTSTSTATATGTRTVTLSKQSTADTLPTGTSGNTSNSGSGSDAECQCPSAATVTVTMPASTVYVTAPAAAEIGNSNSGSGSGNSGVSSTTSAQSPAATDAEGADDECPADEVETGDNEDECSADDSAEAVVTATATATVVPYPTGAPNGTYPMPTGVRL